MTGETNRRIFGPEGSTNQPGAQAPKDSEVTTKQEALAAIGTFSRYGVVVVTKSGNEYCVSKDTLEAANDTEPYVYGFRMNATRKFGMKDMNGNVKHFLLKNVSIKEI